MIERLWNGWRAAYVTRGQGAQPPGDVSLFTSLLRSGRPDEETYIVRRGERVFAIMNAYPYTSGHLLVLPYREVSELEDLDAEESRELWAMVTQAVRTLKAVYRCEALNVGINLGAAAGGSVAQHLHVHVVGRWTGDTNFMVATAETKILPEALDVSARRIRDGWVA